MNTRILLIEDEPALRELIAAVLAEAGYVVSPVEHGRHAMSVLDKNAIDLVVTDLLMPEQDGIETILQVRQRRPALPVLVITGGGRLDANYYVRIAKALGAGNVLRKPFSREELLGHVAALLATRGTPGSGD